MKNTYSYTLLFIFLCCNFLLNAQWREREHWILEEPDSLSKIYVARDSIVLKPGFTYKATPDYFFHGKIDQTLVFPPQANYLTPGGQVVDNPALGGVVGSIPGTFDVSSTGAATYTIPIEVPAGINGMQSQIALTYNSQGGNGIAGWGFNIAGLSAITRVPKTVYSDDNASGVKNLISDGYALDGNRLILNAGTGDYGTDNAVYSTEIETYAKITSKGGSVGNGPDWFEVQAKDGTIYKYGSASGRSLYSVSGKNSVQVWLLDYVENTNGQTIIYEYEHANHHSYLKKIKYGYNSNTTVEFFYETRTDTIPIHFDQSKGYVSKRLYRIKAAYEYDLRYSYTPDLYSRLEKITQKNSYGESFSPTVFEWGDFPTNADITTTDVTVSNLGTPNFSDQSYSSVDLNGDGLSDMVSIFSYGPYTRVQRYIAKRNANGTVSFVLGKDEIDLPPMTEGYKVKWVNGGLLSGNVLGTGKQNAIIPFYMATGNSRGVAFYILDEYNYVHVDYPLVRDSNNNSELPEIAIGDIDNNGRCNIVYVEKIKSSGKYKLVIVEDIIDLEIDPTTIEHLIDLSGKPERLSVVDFDGDGMQDLMVLTKQGSTIFWNQGGGLSSCFSNDHKNTYADIKGRGELDVFALGDYNGDGLPDFVVNTDNNTDWYMVMNNGNKTFTTTKSDMLSYFGIREEGFTTENDNKDYCMVMDFDGDGKSDLVINDSKYRKESDITGSWGEFESHRVYWLRSTGTDFEMVRGSSPTYDKEDALSKYFAIGDFTGSGQQELMFYGYDCFENPPKPTGQAQKWRMYKNPGFTENTGRITAVTNGMNNRTQFEYTTLTDNSVYAKSSDAPLFPVIDIQAPLYVVKQVTANAVPPGTIGVGITGQHKTTYTYEGAKVHTQGKGLLGFSEISASNSIMNRKTTTKSTYDGSFYYPYTTEQKITTVSGNPISTANDTNKIVTLGGKRIFPYASARTVKDELTTLLTKTKIPDLDINDYGNPKTIITTQGNLVTTQTIDYINAGSWCPNKPREIKTEQTYPGEDNVSRDEYFYYDNRGNITLHTKDSASIDKKVQTFYTGYDQYGNPQKITVKAKDATGNLISRSQSFTYTYTGRFVETKTDDQLNETTTYDWNEVNGLLRSETNRLGTTSYQYDRFGRLKLTIYPDGVKNASALLWAGSEGPASAKYYSYTETSGQSPVWVWYNTLGQEIRRDAYGLNNKKVMVSTEYNSKGQVYRTSEPYFETPYIYNKPWAATYTHDGFGRDLIVDTPMGAITTEYDGLTVTVTSPSGTKTTKMNQAGRIFEEITNGKKINFTHYANGQVKTATPQGSTGTIAMEYDRHGNRTKLTDPSAGVIASEYDGWGQLVREEQDIHDTNTPIITTYNYHPSGLLDSIWRNGETTDYAYDHLHRLEEVSIAGKHSQSYQYDEWDRITQVTDVVENNRTFVTKTEYDAFGRIKKETYPTGYYTVNRYSNHGVLTSVKDRSGKLIWQALEENAKGQLTKSLQGNHETTFNFDSRGFPTSIVTPGISEWSYNFNNKGNLEYRQDNLSGYKESFEYDPVNRLKKWSVYHYNSLQKADSILFEPNIGNIEKKSDLGNFTLHYGERDKPPHALTSISGAPTQFPGDDLTVTYTDFKKINTLMQGSKTYALSYGVDEQRIKSVYKTGDETKETRYYLGGYEEVTDSVGITKKIHYLSGGAILVMTGNAETLYYGYYDHLGSLIALTDEQGNVEQRYAFDPWGNRRDPDFWHQSDTRTNLIVNRGFTMHEHLDAFGIINMNGRVYDPLTGMFFSPDPYVQAPNNWLNYNRYAYCLNNPLKYTDPSGEWFLIDDLIAAAIGGIVNVAVNAFQGNIHSWGQGFSLFGVGAGGTWAGLYAGPAVAGLIIGSGNSFVNQGFGSSGNWNWSNISGQQLLFDGFMGGLTGQIGSALGGAISPAVSNLTSGIGGQAVQQGLTQGITGAAVGFTMNTGFALMNGENIGDALEAGGEGALTGFAIGTASGLASGMRAAYKAEENPWNGNQRTSQTNNTSNHAQQRTVERNVSQSDINDALKNPLQVTEVQYRENGPSVKYIGNKVTVVVNPETGKIITVHGTSTKIALKLGGTR